MPIIDPSFPAVALALIGSAAAIYFACEYFVNGVEWIGHRFAMGQKATGALLAAFGTALPESVVTLVAVAFGAGAASKDIGVGAAMGGPLVLATIAYAVAGLTLLLCRRPLRGADAAADFAALSRDQAWFIGLFVVKLGVGLIAFAFKPWLGAMFLAAYALYAWKEATAEAGEPEGKLEPLKLQPRATVPATAMILLQTFLSLAVVFFASRVFVNRLGLLGHAVGIGPQLLALLLSPIATEMPEILNAIIWIRQGKVRMAMANISGSMMIQATVPTALGLFFTPWLLQPSLIAAGAVTLAAMVMLWAGFRSGRISRLMLAATALFYGLFLAVVLFGHLS
ncbi:MAG TPA: sodium:calcium antiporter [Caulobacteraceae bacterium]|nr:sodium:calcium antiporter [Caulobacteraceae bacterium]